MASQARGLTFTDALDRYCAAKLDELATDRDRMRWRSMVERYALPEIGAMLVHDIAVQDVLRVLQPIWGEKTETARKLRSRIENILSWATVAGHRAGDNPARWRGNLAELLPKPGKIADRGNHPAVALDEAAAWFKTMRQSEGLGAKALAFLTLCASRSGEVRGMTWDEIDMTAKVWTISAERMKAERDRILVEARKGKGEKRTAAEADLNALGREPAAPPSTDRTVTEPTFEGLTRKFAEGMPTLGIFSDEGGQFLGGFAMASENRQKTLAALNDLWQGNPIRRTRQGEGSYTLFGRRLAVHLMVQPGVARAFMADPMAADTGFLPRFLICEPVSTIGTRLQSLTRHDGLALAAFTDRLRAILDRALPMDEETRELEPRTLPLSGEARAMLMQFSDAVEAAQAPGGEYAHITGYASKAAEQACRIAGVLTAWGALDAPEATGETMAHAITLAAFYLGEAARLSDAATVSAEVEKAEALRQWLLTRWQHPEVLPGDVVQRAPIRALRESPAAKAAIATLVKHGWLIALPEGTEVRGKARKEAYRIARSGHEV